MNCSKSDTSFCHHISGNGRVKTSADENCGSSACANRNTACSSYRLTVNISAKVTDFNIYNKVGVVNINLEMRKL